MTNSKKDIVTATIVGFALGVALFRGAELSRAQTHINPPKIQASASADLWNTETKSRLRVTNSNVVFIDENGDYIGELSWSKGKLYFTGSAHGTAENFFHNVLKPKVDKYIEKGCKDVNNKK